MSIQLHPKTMQQTETDATARTSVFSKGTDPLKDWLCPITLLLMTNPVVAADGHTYEKSAIEGWFQKHSTSPLDRSAITVKTLYKNTALALAIQEWKRHNPEVVRKDQEEDRQLELAALRAKPKPVVQLPPQPVVSYQPRPYISQVATLTIPGWQVVRNMLSRDHTPQTSPRYPMFTPMSASTAVVPM